MGFKIVDVEFYQSPCGAKVDSILSNWGMSCKEIEDSLKNGNYEYSDTEGLHDRLEASLMMFFKLKGHFIAVERKYHHEFNLEADVVVQKSETRGKRIYVEIEFRDKGQYLDIVEFLVGYKHDLDLGVLIVAKNKKNLKYAYRTVIEFHSCKNILATLALECPILLIGFDGVWENEA